jgi:N-acetylmuramoyl-L-alanine amidase CwlA
VPFQKKYAISPRYLTSGSKRRSGKLISPAVKFIVAHDTGNPNSSASGNVRYYENSRNDMSASAHLFVDDKDIIECIPALTGAPEKAWHVLYGIPTDNELYGFNANDAAIGVEYCYGDRIIADESYARYIWVLAFICFEFGLNPAKSIVGHFFLDPQRKTDPVTGLAHSRRTYEQLLKDVATEFDICTGKIPAPPKLIKKTGSVRVTVKLNVRRGEPNTKVPVAEIVMSGSLLGYVGYVENGQSINGNAKWYKDANGNFFWSGGVVTAI